MTYIRQLPSGRWQAILRGTDGRRESQINETREAVERWADSYDPSMPNDYVTPLRQLVLQRLTELGEPGKPLSVREAARRSGGKISPEALSTIARGEHERLSDPVVEGLAEALDVPIGTVLEAAHG